MVMRLPEGDRISISKAKLEADLAVAMGGRIAEKLIFGEEKVTTGASSDIQMATDMARRMVTEWGFSDKLGPLRYSSNQEEVFLGHSMSQTQNMSDATSSLVDSEVRRIVEEGYARAEVCLKENLDDLHILAKALLEYELLSGDEITDLLAGKDISREEEAAPAGPRTSVPRGGSVSESDTKSAE
jgi:cell division protease FtsH